LTHCALRIVERLVKAINTTGSAQLAVSGGTSPLETFKILSSTPINWDRVCVTLVDDRNVLPDHKDSNEALIKSNLLVNFASAAKFIPIFENTTEVLGIRRPFDVTLLGMGVDGHFASLFPDMIESNLAGEKEAFDSNCLASVLKVSPRGDPLHSRTTMNLSMILESRAIFLLVNGPEKLRSLEEARHNKSIPVHYLLSQTKTPVIIEKS
jgi:6-phosphogluconolactonase